MRNFGLFAGGLDSASGIEHWRLRPGAWAIITCGVWPKANHFRSAPGIAGNLGAPGFVNLPIAEVIAGGSAFDDAFCGTSWATAPTVSPSCGPAANAAPKLTAEQSTTRIKSMAVPHLAFYARLMLDRYADDHSDAYLSLGEAHGDQY